MAHESKGLRLSGDVFIQRLGSDEMPVIGPLAAEYVGATAKSERKTVLDTRRNRRGQVLFAINDPQEPEGKLILLSAPPPVLAMAFLGRSTTAAQATGTITSEEHLFTNDYGIKLTKRNVSSVVVSGGACATLDTGTVINNDAITWTAVFPGTSGNNITVALVNPSANSRALSVSIVTNAITVSLETNVSGAIVSTAADIIEAISDNSTISTKVTAANKSTSTGAGIVSAVAATALSGGSSSGTTMTLGSDYEIIDAREGIIRPLIGGRMAGSSRCFVTYSYGAIREQVITLGTDVTLRAKVVLIGTNDTDSTADPVRWECSDALLSVGGEINLMSAEPIKVELGLTPLTPAGATTPVTMSWPTYD